MHSLAYQQSTGLEQRPLISIYQSVPRNNRKLTRIREAVKAWQKATPGQSQVHISQLVAKELAGARREGVVTGRF